MKEPFFLNIKSLTLRKFSWLWFKFYWYKWILRKDIIGFYAGVPIIRTDEL